MIEIKRKVKKSVEVEEVVKMDLQPFWMVRIIRVGAYNKKECVFEREFSHEPNEQEIADVLIDWNKKNVFASVVKNYRLVEVEEDEYGNE